MTTTGGKDTAANALYGVTDLLCVCRGCETATLSVDRLLGHSFKTPKVPCDCLKVGLDYVLNEWPSCRSVVRVIVEFATLTITNARVIIYYIQENSNSNDDGD